MGGAAAAYGADWAADHPEIVGKLVWEKQNRELRCK